MLSGADALVSANRALSAVPGLRYMDAAGPEPRALFEG